MIAQLVALLGVLVTVTKVYRTANISEVSVNAQVRAELTTAEQKLRGDLFTEIGRLKQRADVCDAHHEKCESELETIKRMYLHPVERDNVDV